MRMTYARRISEFVEELLGSRLPVGLRQDYRELRDEPFDAVASAEMVEHVGEKNYPTYAGTLFRMVRYGRTAVPGWCSRRAQPVADIDSQHDTAIAAARYLLTRNNIAEPTDVDPALVHTAVQGVMTPPMLHG